MMPLEALGNPILNIVIFGLFVVGTLTVVIKVTSNQNKAASSFYTGGAQFSGTQNGFAIAGDYLSAASFLGIAGAIAFNGYDGLLYSIGFLVAWLVALLLVAEPLRNTGRYTMADVLSFRMRQKPVRWRLRCPPSPYRSSTCWRRWRVRVASSHCCWGSTASSPRTRSSSSWASS